ncbi:helix-turn-helix domain-containing protein [Aeromonas caviae]|uniref:helix-turn-helix domain-containing protein n=1 Tax=Aeromonas hydrophila TaxID=644 RepID=UPI003EC94402
MYKNPFPERLKQARKKAGISQKELGVRAGMDDSSASGRMNHYERGRHVPDIDTMRKLANVLGKPLSYFFAKMILVRNWFVYLSNLMRMKS